MQRSVRTFHGYELEVMRGSGRRGLARRGEARLGEARHGEAGRGEARRGTAWRGRVRRGLVWPGMARRGEAWIAFPRGGAVSRPLVCGPEEDPLFSRSGRGAARRTCLGTRSRQSGGRRRLQRMDRRRHLDRRGLVERRIQTFRLQCRCDCVGGT